MIHELKENGRIITAKLPSLEELIKKILIFAKSHPDWSLDEQYSKFNVKYSGNLTSEEYYGLLWNNDYANKIKTKIEELHLKCPSCNSDEYHTPLFDYDKMICFICGKEYSLPSNYKDEFPYNHEVEQERQEYGLKNLEHDHTLKIEKEKLWDLKIKRNMEAMNLKWIQIQNSKK